MRAHRPASGPRSVGTAADGVTVPAEVDWVLARAFGREPRPGSDRLDGPAVVEAARRLGLLPRVVHALGPERLEADLGPGPASEALADYRESALVSAKLVALARLVGRVASANGIRVVALKHAALCLAGVTSPAARGAVDADLLVADVDAPRLTEALASVGIKVSTAPAYEHQHRPLVHREAGMLELHRTVPGVRVEPGGGDARLEAIVAAGLAAPLTREEPGLLIPPPHVLVAHALAHGLFQHGLEPRAYPPWKLLADLANLRRTHGDDLLEAALPLVAETVNAEDARAAWALPALLGAGGAEEVLSRPDTPEARLLSHLLRGALDPGYAESLRIRAVLGLPSDRHGLAGLVAGAWHALAISPAQARNLYGAKNPATYALVLALRPFHLVAKLLRYGVIRRGVRS